MFRPNNGDQYREEDKLFVQQVLLRRFQGDQQLIYKDLPEFMEHPLLKELLQKHSALQDDIHRVFLEAGYGATTPAFALESAPVIASEDLHVSAPEVMEELVAEEENLIHAAAAIPNLEEVLAHQDVQAVEHVEEQLENLAVEKYAEENDADFLDVVADEKLESDELQETSPDLPESSPEFVASENELDAPSPEDVQDQDLGTEAYTAPAEGAPTQEEQRPVEPPIIPVKLNLPNAKTGQAYLQKIDLSPLHRKLESITEIVSTGFEAAGMQFIQGEALQIEGMPNEAGKFKVEILVKYAAEDDRPAQSYRLIGEIDIMPDPRKLWKELEPDASLPYQKPHLRSESLHMAGRTMVAASRRGRSHAHNGTFRDDDFEIQVNEAQSWYLMAVADGAGSAPYARRGAEIACQKVMEVLADKLDERLTEDLGALGSAWAQEPNEQLRGQIRNRIYDALSHAAYAGYKAIGEEAEAMGETPKAFHTTLLITIVRQYDFGYFVGTWWVGDGAVGILQRGKYLKVMGAPDGGEFAGQTRFLTMPDTWSDGSTVAKRIEFDIVEDFSAIMLMSDGISDPKFHTDYNMLQLENWDKLWDDLGEAVDFEHDNLKVDTQLLEWLDFWASGEHDDRTIAILY
jgi:hypothetical protein